MRIIIGCEFSGIVREAFRKSGHEAWSCDLLPSKIPGPHLQGDVRNFLGECQANNYKGWDLGIFFPPCTHLAVSGAKHFHKKQLEQKQALDFVSMLLNAPIEKIALENPVGVISTKIRKPDQIIQPYMFGHEATKTTCLWLKNLPKLMPTKIVDKGKRHITKGGNSLPEWYNLPPGPDRWKIRSATFQGIADAMADQWDDL